MKKIVSSIIIIAIIMSMLKITSSASDLDNVLVDSNLNSNSNNISSNPCDILNPDIYTNEELDLSKYTINDILDMSANEYGNLISEFERVYDPFNSYGKTDNDEFSRSSRYDRMKKNFRKKIKEVATGWCSGAIEDGVWVEKASHEYMSLTASIILAHDKGFFATEKQAVCAALLISLASLLPDDLEIGVIPFAGHFYNPNTGKNYANQKSNTVVTNANKHYNAAVAYAQNGDMLRAFKYLGFCLHYVQDACEPHHASNITIFHKYGDSHNPFEEFVNQNNYAYLENYNTMSDVFYQTSITTSVSDITHEAAVEANGRIDDVKNIEDQSKWDEAGEACLKSAARYSAMVLYKFSQEEGVPFTNKNQIQE